MELKADAKIAFPRALVFSTYRDRLPELVPYLPDVKEIRALSREEEGAIASLKNEWVAATEIPKVAQAVVKPEMLQWLDFAKWDAEAFTCDWRIETKMFTEQVRCQGHNTYVEADDGESCVLQIRGELSVSLKGVPGVPRFLAGRVAPHVERFVVDMLTPNLLSVAKGLQAFLDAESAG